MIDFYHYHIKAMRFAVYKNPIYPALGLAGEAGEFAGKVSKIARASANPDVWDVMSGEERTRLIEELGDVLWMVAACASHLGVEMEEVALINLNKLESRAKRGVIEGDGDDR